ncbi:MAG: nucleotidyl transferase AbiEii/AbiGii toxin family protein [Streptosporangiaceae bacterium]
MDAFHERLALVALRAGSDLGFALAGGYAVQAHGFLKRPSEDVDLFTSAERTDFRDGVATIKSAYEKQGIAVRVDTGHAFLATEGGSGDTLLGTFDGGLHWSVLITSGGSFCGWSGPIFVAAETGFVVGPTHYAPEHLYRTTEGGHSWHIVRF